MAVGRWNRQIKGLKKQEASNNAADTRNATTLCTKAEILVAEAEEVMEALQTFLDDVGQD